MNKTEFQSKTIERNDAMSKSFVAAYGTKPNGPWPFPTSKSMSQAMERAATEAEVFYENPRNSIKRFRLLKNLDIPSIEKLMVTVPKTVTTFKPDRAPMQVLSDSTEGIHFAPMGYLKSVIDPSYDQTHNKQLQEALKKQGFPKLNKETDPHGKNPNSPGAKVDAGKTKAWLFMAGFSRALKEVAKVTTVGASKYTPNGWVTVPDGQARYMDAFGRHLFDLGSGATVDDGEGGTGCLHKAQMIWNLLASLELELREKENGKAAV